MLISQVPSGEDLEIESIQYTSAEPSSVEVLRIEGVSELQLSTVL